MRYIIHRLPAMLTVLALAACSGGLNSMPQSQSVLPPSPAIGARATTVTVSVRNGTKPIPAANVELYTGKRVDKCPPFGFPCVKKVKSLASGTTKKNGTVRLSATFSSSQLVCAEAAIDETWIQDCRQPFPGSVVLQFH